MKSILRFSLRLSIIFVFLLLTGCKIKTYIEILSNGMEPTLKINEKYEVEQVVLKDLQRRDIVVFQFNGKELIKRVIGLPGDTIEIRYGEVYINNEPLLEEYIQNSWGTNYDLIKLEDNQYFVLGDNRRFSMDSYLFGPINGDSITKRVVLNE